MKKLVLLFTLLCTTLSGLASVFDWYGPDEGKYSGSSPVIVNLNVNGIKVDRETRYSLPVYLGNIYAFIDGECRAVSYDMVEDQDFFLLNVQGNKTEMAGQPSDAGKEIEFRMEALDLVYTFTKTVKFTGERQEITLNLDAITDIKLPQEDEDGYRIDIVNYEDEFPFSFDVKDSLVYVYEGNDGKTTARYNESSLYAELFYELDVDDVKVKTDGTYVVVPFLEEPANAQLHYWLDNSDFNHYINFTINTAIKTNPVTSISIDPTSIIVKKGVNIKEYIRENVTVTVLPEDASNKSWGIDVPEGFPDGLATTAGTYTLYIYSTDNAEIKAPLTVVVKEDVSFSWTISDVTLVRGETASAAVVVSNIVNTEDFDASKITLKTSENGGAPDLEMAGITDKGDGTYTISLLPNYADSQILLGFSYEGRTIGEDKTVTVNGKAELQEGWNWVSLYTEKEDNNLIDFKVSDISEIRSQSDILINDAKYGFFGTLTYMDMSNAMFQIKANKNTKVLTGSNRPEEATETVNVYAGFTWMNNANQVNIPAKALKLFANVGCEEGDYIITKNNFAVYSDKEWIAGEGFSLNMGEGFIYFNASNLDKDITVNQRVNQASINRVASAGAKVLRAAKNWEFDSSKYPDNMAIIATLPDIENASDYSVGALVGDEVRGQGGVAVDNLLFINVAGKAGEKVTFKLLNKYTGEVLDIEGSLNYAMMKGTMNSPVVLSVPGYTPTGIKESSVNSLDDTKAIYDLSGRRVMNASKGLYISAGKKYIKK